MVRLTFLNKNKKVILFVIIFIIAIIIYFYSFRTTYYETFQNKNAIVILTRGYTDKKGYDKLIKRNKAIYDVFYSKLDDKYNYDVVIYHEGNITVDQQEYIQSMTKGLPLVFKEVSFQKNKQINTEMCPPTLISEYFPMGYKNMCYFWSISMFEYMSSYEYIIRIDEDCIIDSLDPNTIDKYKADNIMFSSGMFQGNDMGGVIIGMRSLFDAFLKKKTIQ
jgi:hypothetical protein